MNRIHDKFNNLYNEVIKTIDFNSCDPEYEIEIFDNFVDEVNDYNRKLISYMEKWVGLLEIEGSNTKLMVLNDIQYLLKELKNEEV